VVAGGNGLARRSPGGAVRQIEPSLGHPQQVRAVGEAGGGVREFETMRANCRYSSCLITGFISPIRKRVCLDKSGTRDAFPGTWEVALEEPGNFKYFGGQSVCRLPRADDEVLGNSLSANGAGTNAKYLSSQVERLFRAAP